MAVQIYLVYLGVRLVNFPDVDKLYEGLVGCLFVFSLDYLGMLQVCASAGRRAWDILSCSAVWIEGLWHN